MATLNELSQKTVFDANDLQERIDELECIIDRIKEIEEILLDEFAGENYTSDEIEALQIEIDEIHDILDEPDEYDSLLELRDEIGESTLRYGETMIRESYMTDYLIELVYDIGDLPKDLPGYIENNIDWDGVCDDLKMDYSECEINGITFYFRQG